METCSEQSEVAAILMDVSQQDQAVYSNQSQAATILMNVGQSKSRAVLLDVQSQFSKDEEPEATSTVLMEADGDRHEMYSITDTSRQSDVETGKQEAAQQMYAVTEAETSTVISPHTKQQFKVMSSDGGYHTVTLTGFEEKITESGEIQTSSIIQVETPGQEPETITVSGLTDNYNLESLAQIAEIVVNSTNRSSNSTDLMEDTSVTQTVADGLSYTEVPDRSQYIAMKGTNKVISDQDDEAVTRNVLQTVAVDSSQGSQNLVSLAQIAELVINQGCLEVGDGQASSELQISSDSNNQPLVISGLETSIANMQTVTSTQKKLQQPQKTEYITVPFPKTKQPTTRYLPVTVRGSQKQMSVLPDTDSLSSYTTTLLPDSRQNPPHRSSSGKNIYSKIKAENGECYMVVLPESDPLNPAQLHGLLTSYNMAEAKQVEEVKASQTVGERVKPQMYSTCSQTTRKCPPLPKANYTGTKHEPIPGTSIVIVEPAIASESNYGRTPALQTATKLPNTEIHTVCELVSTGTSTDPAKLPDASDVKEKGMEISKEETVFPLTIKTEKVDPEDSQASGDTQTGSLNNCGHEVAMKKSPGDGPLPETQTVSIQTDVTANCYLNVDPEELSIHNKKPRNNYGNKRIYLDDPKPSKEFPEGFEMTISPFLSRKNLLDVENAFYICGMCGVKYTTAEELKVHSKTHKSKKAFCPTCKKKCGNLKILADHVISHTRCKTFKCCVCTTDTVFKSAADFKEHVAGHLGERYFICGSCNTKFLHVANLKVHMRVHTGEKPFKCAECEASFSQKASLEAHISSFHKNEKPFQCEDCGVNFARKTDLRIHARKHTGERPYSCDVCNKTFSSNSGLTSHKKTHFRKRFHQCGDCDKSFDTPARLKRHTLNWHTGERALKCRICDMEFTTREDVRNHMTTHSIQPYPCVSCSFGTSSKEYLTKHIKTAHPELIDKMPELFEKEKVVSQVKKENSPKETVCETSLTEHGTAIVTSVADHSTANVTSVTKHVTGNMANVAEHGTTNLTNVTAGSLSKIIEIQW